MKLNISWHAAATSSTISKIKDNSFFGLSSLMLSAFLLTSSQLSLAITAEEGKETFLWEMYQRNAANTGYMPISLNIDGSTATDSSWGSPFNSKVMVTHQMQRAHPLVAYHLYQTRDADDYLDNLGAGEALSDYFYVSPQLNQATVSRDFLFVTNRGYRTAHHIYVVEREGGTLENWNYLSSGAELAYAGTTEPWFPTDFCPTSQGQPIYKDDILYFVSNFYDTGQSSVFCIESDLDTQYSIFRSHIYEKDKSGGGVQKYQLWVGEQYHTQIDANTQDEFLGATYFDNKIYTQGGGIALRRGYTGVYAFENRIDELTPEELVAITPESGEIPPVYIDNLWDDNPNFLNYPRLAPNNRWVPAVNDDYVITFTNGYVANDYEDNIGELNVLDRSSGDILFTITVDNFAPEDSDREYFMDNGPVLADSDTVIVINNDNLINFNLRTRGVDWSIEDGFYGQPSVSTSDNVIYAASNDSVLCGGDNLTCIVGVTLDQKPILLDDEVTRLVWVAPTNTTIQTPFVLTDTHIFVSTVSTVNDHEDMTYGISLSTSIDNASRAVWNNDRGAGVGYGGKLSFAYNTLYVAHSGQDTVRSDDPTIITRPTIRVTDLAGLTLDNGSFVLAYPFDVDLSVSADLEIEAAVSDEDDDTTTPGMQARIEDDVVFTVTVTNNGTLTATSPVVTAEVPFSLTLTSYPDYCSLSSLDLTCDLSIPIGADGLADGDDFEFDVTGVPTAVGTLTFDFSVDSEKLDPVSSNDVTVTVYAIAADPTTHDLSLSITPEESVANPNGTIIYNVLVSNAGPDVSTAISVTLTTSEYEEVSDDSLPSNCAVNSTEEVEEEANLGTTLNCSIDRIESGSSAGIRIAATALTKGSGQLTGSVVSNRTNATDSNEANGQDIPSSPLVTIEESSVLEIPDLPTSSGSINWLGLILMMLGAAIRKMPANKLSNS